MSVMKPGFKNSTSEPSSRPKNSAITPASYCLVVTIFCGFSVFLAVCVIVFVFGFVFSLTPNTEYSSKHHEEHPNYKITNIFSIHHSSSYSIPIFSLVFPPFLQVFFLLACHLCQIGRQLAVNYRFSL